MLYAAQPVASATTGAETIIKRQRSPSMSDSKEQHRPPILEPDFVCSLCFSKRKCSCWMIGAMETVVVGIFGIIVIVKLMGN